MLFLVRHRCRNDGDNQKKKALPSPELICATILFFNLPTELMCAYLVSGDTRHRFDEHQQPNYRLYALTVIACEYLWCSWKLDVMCDLFHMRMLDRSQMRGRLNRKGEKG
jgi:hypothetical protein